MKTNKQRKNKRDRRILVAALLVGAMIVTGSTFAWFTSKDEVTNRLSASANYGVSIAEDFQPPEDWIPGQPVNKDVSAVNTGNVDAFVRMWLEGEMSVMKKDSLANSYNVPDSITAGLGLSATAAGDTMNELGFKFYSSDTGKYYKVLSATERSNPELNGTNADPDDNNYSEVKTVQAGGYLVSAPENAKWSYVTEQQTTLKVYDSSVPGYVTEEIAKGVKVGTSNTDGIAKTIEGNAPCRIDSDTFVPQTPGLYIFRRTIDLNGTSNAADSYEYSGYVFDGTNYFALYSDETDTKSDYVLPDGAVTAATQTEPQKEPLTYTLNNSLIRLYSASETVVKNSGLTWTFDSGVLKATYDGGTSGDTEALKADDIIIDITLANLGGDSQQWTRRDTSGGLNTLNTFYYNDDLEAGDSTAKLVDTVTLNSAVTQKAFIAFDFDLNVFLESIQVTLDENGKELATTVNAGTGWAATGSPAVNTGAKGTADNTSDGGNQEIGKMSWSSLG